MTECPPHTWQCQDDECCYPTYCLDCGEPSVNEEDEDEVQ